MRNSCHPYRCIRRAIFVRCVKEADVTQINNSLDCSRPTTERGRC